MGKWDLGRAVATVRERRGWSREALAFCSGLSWSAIAQIETGRRTDVRPSTLTALAAALDVSVDYLIGRAGAARSSLVLHHAFLYEADATFVETLAPFLAAGVERDQPVLAVTSELNQRLLAEAMGAAAESVEFADSTAWYGSPSAAIRAFRQYIGDKIDHGAPWIRIVGQPNWGHCADEQARAWIRYESLANVVFAEAPAHIICAYDVRSVTADIVSRAGHTHPQLTASGIVTHSDAYEEPEAFLLGP